MSEEQQVWAWVPISEVPCMTRDPFFKDDDIIVIIPHREELTLKLGVLVPELSEWFRINAPGTNWTYRYPQNGDVFLVFKFTDPVYAVHFKMRWQ